MSYTYTTHIYFRFNIHQLILIIKRMYLERYVLFKELGLGFLTFYLVSNSIDFLYK